MSSYVPSQEDQSFGGKAALKTPMETMEVWAVTPSDCNYTLSRSLFWRAVLCEGNTRNRWRDGQVGPDVRQGTMALWARRLGCVLACYAQIGRGSSRETLERREKKDQKKRKVGRGVRERREKGGRKRRTSRVRERERTEGEDRRDGWRKGKESGIWSEKDDEHRWR
ncbi:hypothetical protein TNCV_1617731 [Trichonephila clavipes]|nr:hypothetical protein TNCV_1617731 [Trichonephila clavipes]